MAVFTAVATAIVGAVATAGTILGSTFLFNLAVGVVATGLAMGTAKILGLYDPPTPGPDQGVKIQLAPSTDNKIAKLYGDNFAAGPIIDAEIKNQNKTMTYCIVLSEYTSGETWTINEIYRGDAKLNFSGANVISQVDPNATTTTDIANKIRVRVYAGGSSASDQIFPTTGAVNAYGGPVNGGTGQMRRWNSANTMTDLVFALVEIDYDPENQLTGLGAMTFNIKNSITNPADVLQDYATNTRYGAGLANSMLDSAAITAWQTYCSEQVDYINSSNVTVQHARYELDGGLSTFTEVSKNIGSIVQNGGAFFSYNAKQGKFAPVILRAATTAELANAYVFNDDNIISSISFGTTELFSQFNSIEVEYPSYNQKDQTDVYFSEIDPSLRNPNEPDNTLQISLNLCNDRSRVAQLANIEINQNRLSTVLEFTADYSSMVVDVGDVVKVTVPLYGYDEKLFRVMRLSETEDSEGVLSVKFLLLEYDSDVYGDLLTQEDLPKLASGIDNYYSLYSNSELDIEAPVKVVNDPSVNETLEYSTNANYTGTGTLAEVDNRVYAQGASLKDPFIAVEVAPPANVQYTHYLVDVTPYTDGNVALSGENTYQFNPPAGASLFEAQTYKHLCIPISGAGVDTFNTNGAARFGLKLRGFDSVNSTRSRATEMGNFPTDPRNYIVNNDLQDLAAGFQAVEAPAPVTNLSNTGQFYAITSSEVYDLEGVDQGEYPFYADARPLGEIDGTYNVGLLANVQFDFRNVSNGDIQSYGADYTLEGYNLTEFTTVSVTADLPIISSAYGLSDEYVPDELRIQLFGANTMDENPAGQIGFSSIFFTVDRITKGLR